MANYFKIILIVLGLSEIKGQIVNLNCLFAVTANVYTCQISGASVEDNENANIIIGGQHQQGFGDGDVRRVNIFLSNIPFVVSQFFTTFVNVSALTISSAGLTRIQTNAFANAQNLNDLSINANQLLTTIHANAFQGAPNLVNMDLLGNQIETINGAAFTGLSSVLQIFLDHNRLQVLPANVFQPLLSLQGLYLSNNQLESLSGRLLAHNNDMRRLEIARNRINAIGRSFLDGTPRLSFFDTVGNNCTNSLWNIGGVTTIETVRLGLSTCFDNYGPDENELRRFVIEVRGPFVLLHENGTEIIRL